MTAVVFVGPSLPKSERDARSGFAWAPPAAQGDVYRAVRCGAAAVGIIDGYFDGVPAVWHKEILWAMAEGIHVFGAASMGALRAAELADFGMRGVGRIFEAYRAGELTDDAEVAVLHGPAEAGYPPVTEPMVNVRASLAHAAAEGILDGETGAGIEALAKAQFYQERTWDTVLRAAAGAGLPAPQLEAFRSWLPRGKIDQKRADALAMLAAMREFLDGVPGPMRAAYRFERTELWASAPWQCEDGSGRDPEEPFILDELRLLGAAYRVARDQALLRALAAEESGHSGVTAERAEVRAEINAFRRRHGLMRRADLDRWCAAAGTEPARFERMMAEEASLSLLAHERSGALAGRILDRLRLAGDYGRLAERARRKARALNERATTAEPPSRLLYEWYFHERLEKEIPDDLERFAGDLGLDGTEALRRLLLREYLYAIMAGDGAQ